MEQVLRMKKRNKSPFLISLGMCGGKPTLLNVNCIEYMQHEVGNYVFAMKSGKVFTVAKSTALNEWLKPFIVGHEVN